jgi:predicted PhzF superfamily epimerase YddE/YHI9
MADYAFRIVNVFAETALGGNPLAVFEDARGLDTATMQALALQFNLSETTFVLPSGVATACVRIFTPAFEMPFAGHPTLGTAHVVRDRWTLTANAPHWRRPDASRRELAGMLGVSEDDVIDDALWVDTGSEQLVLPWASFDAVRRAAPTADALQRHGHNGARAMAYVFARDGDRVLARFFFPKHGSVIEDPGTGSACANLGGWLIATGAALPAELTIDQGEAVGRPCRLGLAVDGERRIQVTGRVVELGRGTINL